MPTNLKYTPGTTRICKACGQPFIVPTRRQITGDFCSPRCGIYWGLSRSPKWSKRRDTTRPTADAPAKANPASPKGGAVSPDLSAAPRFGFVSVSSEAPPSQPATDRN